MNGSIPITVEWAFGILFSFILAAFWHYVRGLSERFNKSECDRAQLHQEINQVKLDYMSKDEARTYRSEIADLLREIKADVKEVSEKLDRKADK